MYDGEGVGKLMYPKWAVPAISCVLLLALFSVMPASTDNIAHAQSSESIVPAITLASNPCPEDGSDPTCLIATGTSLQFKISFSPPIDRDTFTAGDVVFSGNFSQGQLTDENLTFIYHLYSGTDNIITLRVPAGAVSDMSNNTNSEAEITIRTDLRRPTIKISDEYVDGYGGYGQYVKIKEPYVAPDITCVDDVYDDGVLIRTDDYTAVTDDVVMTDIEPEDLPKIVHVSYACTDDSGQTDIMHIDVHLVEDLSVVSTPPRIEVIERSDPITENTDSQTLVYAVRFSKIVIGVDKDDFVLSPDSTGGPSDGTSPVTSVSGIGERYFVTVSATQDGTYNIDLVSSGHGIVDVPNNPLVNTTPTGADQTYAVSTAPTDSTAPAVSSIERSNPSGAATDSQTLVYKVTFSEDVTGVDKNDFALSSGPLFPSPVLPDDRAKSAASTPVTSSLNVTL